MGRISRRELLRSGARAAAAIGAAHILPAFAQTSSAAPAKYSTAFRRLDEYVNRRLRELNAPGLTLALADRNGAVRVATYGFADVKTKTPARPDHLFQIGSISKSFAAICCLQLVQEGKLDLHRPIREYLPWLEIDSSYEPITTHHLLSHTSGLPDDAPLNPRGPLPHLWVGFPPGSHYSYSNSGYQILGLLLEKLDGRRWPELVRARVLAPLQMNATEPVINDTLRPRTAAGYWHYYPDYVYPPGGPLGEAPWIEFEHASGSISSTPADMARYMSMLLNRGAGALSPAGFDLLIKPVQKATSWGEAASYAYGFAVDELPMHGSNAPHLRLRHTGGMVAFSSAIHIDLTGGVAGFASTNSNLERYRPNDIVSYALDLVRAVNDRRELPTIPPPDDPARVENGSDYAGEYTPIGYGSECGADVIGPDGKPMLHKCLFRIGSEGTTISVQPGGDIALSLDQIGKDRFVGHMPQFARYSFVFNRENGIVTDLLYGPMWLANDRYAGAREFQYPKEWQAFAGHYRNNDPWQGSVRVFLRKGKLWLADDELTPLPNGLFRPGKEEYSPERVSFDTIVEGKAQRMNFSGVDFDRVGEM